MLKNITCALTLALTIFILQSCKQKENTAEQDNPTPTESTQTKAATPGFVHAVYFWLNDDNPELVDDFINNGLPALAEVPSIQSVSWVNFATAEDQDAYQVDSLHVVFVEKYKSIFEKVQVYDNLVNHHVVK